MGTPESLVGSSRADIVVMPRMAWRRRDEARAFVRSLTAIGKMVVYEADDNIFDSSSYVVGGFDEETKKRWLNFTHQAKLSLMEMNGATVSTSMLSARVRSLGFSKPLEVVGNYIDLRWWNDVLRDTRRDIKSPSVGWAGGRRNLGDLKDMLHGWQIVAEMNKDVTFVTVGFEIPHIYDFVPSERHVHVPWLAMPIYPQAYKQIDIGCAPLANNTFNWCKTPIKVMEYGAAGAAAIASRVVYGAGFSEKDGVLFAETPDEWARAILTLLHNDEERQARAATLLNALIDRYWIETNAHRWVSAWQRIIAENQGIRLMGVPNVA